MSSMRLFILSVLVTCITSTPYDGIVRLQPDGTQAAYLKPVDIISNHASALEQLPKVQNNPEVDHHQPDHPDDVQGLTDFANALDYKNWGENKNWMNKKFSVCDWHGITCSKNTGRVVGVSLEHNGLKGALPVSLGSLLTELETLILSGGRPANYKGCVGNDLQNSSLPLSFYKMIKLQVVNLEYVCLGGRLEDMFHNMTGLTQLSLHGNYISGTVPKSLNYCTNLEILKLGRNPINGSFPLTYLSSLTKAVQMNCNFCALTGIIPDDAFAPFVNMEETYWDGNGFTGSLPSSIGKLKKLTRFSFNINNFTGKMPDNWGKPGNLPLLKDCRVGNDTDLTAYLANYPWVPKVLGNVYDCPLPKYASGNGICNHVTNTHPVTNPRSPTSCRNNSRIRNKSLIHNAAEFDVKNCSLQKVGEPVPRIATSVLNQFAVFVVTSHFDNPMSGQVNIFDAETKGWSATGRMLSPSRTNMCTTSWNHLAIFAGGSTARGHPKSTFVDIWDSSTNAWSVMNLRIGRDLLACASAGDITLFAGGSAPQVNQSETDSVEIYNHITKLWTTATLSLPRKKPEAVTVGSKIVIAGGETGRTPDYTDVIDIFDTDTNTWTTSRLNGARQYFGAAHASGAHIGSSDAGVAVFAGGFFNDLRLGDVDIFDPYNGKSGKHYTTDHLYQNRSNLHGVTVGKNGRWAAFGPGNIVAEAKITLDFYDGETGNWAHRKSHVEMVDQGVASVGNVAFFVGADGYADTFALDGNCSMFDDVVSSSTTDVVSFSTATVEVEHQWVFKTSKDVGYVHMSTIEQAGHGGPLAVAFQATPGSKTEGSDTQSIYLKLSKDNGITWAPHTVLIKPGFTQAVWGPALSWDKANEEMVLFFSASVPENERGNGRSYPGGNIYITRSNGADLLKNWSTPELLLGFRDKQHDDGKPVSKVTANKPAVDGLNWLLPFWSEAHTKGETGSSCAGVLLSSDGGKSFTRSKDCLESKEAGWLIENTISFTGNGTALQFFRTKAGHIWQSFSTDNGASWSMPNATDRLNPNSKTFLCHGNVSNQLLLSYNPSSKKRDPLALAMSMDNGLTWKDYAILDQGGVQNFAYPTTTIANNTAFTVYSADIHTGIRLAKVVLSTNKQ